MRADKQINAACNVPENVFPVYTYVYLLQKSGGMSSTPLGAVEREDDSRSFVSMTARAVACMRARETAKLPKDRICVDPFAAALAGDDADSWLSALEPAQQAFSVDMLAVRTRFIDDFIQATLAAGVVRQIVIVGSGLDTRAYRMCART